MNSILLWTKILNRHKYNFKKDCFRNGTYCQFVLRCSSSICFKDTLDLTVKTVIEDKWKDNNNFKFDEANANNKYYVLSMIPYPSGNLHMGHVRVYTISDVLARFHRLNGKNVLHPMGFDAFGLPAENAAMERNVDPEEWTYKNISTMKNQLESLRYTFDWDREVITCSENFYKFTQYIFLKLYKAGLVYRKEALVNWDPVDKTVLADEQVDSSGRSWRSGALVEKKLLKQWFVKTTQFALPLYEGLSDPKLKDWRDIIKLQKHWIGDCNGATFQFDIIKDDHKETKITIWTQHPEHIRDATFIAASPESVFGIKNNKKHGKLNFLAYNPINDSLLPVYVTDKLQYDEGCDLKLGIPSKHVDDEAFAKENNIPFNSNFKILADFEERSRICELAQDAEIGGFPVSSKLRDWLISRQRRWGTPIPVVHCEVCGTVPCKVEDLPVRLTETKEAPCPKCGAPGKQERDTMDTFVDSSWYYLRYIDPHNPSEPYSTSKANNIMPVDLYIGGKEHAVLHLYYARFIGYFLHSIGLLKEPEPFRRLIVQGMIMGKAYQIKETGKYLSKEKVKKSENNLVDIDSGKEVVEVWEKMSKSKFNGIEPEDVIKQYGIDTTRLLILADVAPTSDRHWKSDTFGGILNWQQRLWSLLADFTESKVNKNVSKELDINQKEKELWDARNFYVKGTTFNYVVSHQLSVAISKMQGLTKTLRKCDKVFISSSLEFERALAALIIMLYPMTPHFASELWLGFQNVPNKIDINQKYVQWGKPVTLQKWPLLDDNYSLELVCKVNNAIKATVKLPSGCINKMSKNEALSAALSDKKVSNFIKGCDILDCDFFLCKNYEAVINIEIDHWQKRQLALKS